MADAENTAPPGFVALPEGLGFTDCLRPVYRRESGPEGGLALGMFVQAQQCNMLGICHGGALMTLADVSAATAVNFARQKLAGAPTLNLSFDFISAAKEGDWLEASADRVQIKRTFGFSSGVISCGDRIVCRFNGTFYTPEHDGFNQNLDKIARLHRAGSGASD